MAGSLKNVNKFYSKAKKLKQLNSGYMTGVYMREKTTVNSPVGRVDVR
jgi:hypothetical protein